MSGEDFDPCECIFNHEMAMRRLLSLLRSSQSYCQDNECQDGALPGPGESTGPDNSFLMMTMAWVVLAVTLYFLRPNSLRNDTNGKPSNGNNNGGDGGNNPGGPRDPEPPAVQ